MTSRNWRQIKDRLAAMDGAELRDRLRQEFARRRDGFLSEIGYNFAQPSPYLASASPGSFFFSQNSITPILTVLRQRMPDQVKEIVRRAEGILRHRFDLLGYTDLDYGEPIDWHLDAVHGKRAPRKISHKIRYLDFAEVGDAKVTWELNRHQHLVTLAKAYRLTDDHRYADEALHQWRDWQAANPYPVGINWVSSLEAGFRCLSWFWTYYLLQGSAGVPDLREEWLRGLEQHGRFIERYLSTYFSPNTHLLGEGVALFFVGTLCPELHEADRWKEMGWKIVQQEAVRQVRNDGFHFEQSTYYHVYALDFFLHSAVLASGNGIPIPQPFEQTIEKMLTALCLLGRGGAPPRFGDDDGGRVFDARRNRGEHLLDPLATGAVLFHRGDFKSAAGGLREETVWLLGAEGVRQWDGLAEAEISTESMALADAGFYLMPSGKGTQLVMDAGPLGTQSGGHSHADALSVCLHTAGRLVLIDPGTCEYIGAGNDRSLFRGTAMHNTLRVDGKNQAEVTGPFSWQRLTTSTVEHWTQGKSFDLLVASHDGYHRLEPPVGHQRWVISLRNGIYLVRDVVTGRGRRRVDIAWHLGPDVQLAESGRFDINGTSHNLLLLPAEGHGLEKGMCQESWSPVYGQKAAAASLNFGADAALPAEFAVMLVTLEGNDLEAVSFVRMDDTRPVETAVAEVHGYRYTGAGAEHWFVFGKRHQPWRIGSLSSDAEFVCWIRTLGGRDEQLMFCGGSYARVEAGAELRCVHAVEWAELVLRAGVRTVFSSDMAALEKPAEFQLSNQPESSE